MSMDKAELCDSLLTWVSSASSQSLANYRAHGLTGDRQQVLAQRIIKIHARMIFVQNAALRRIAVYSCVVCVVLFPFRQSLASES